MSSSGIKAARWTWAGVLLGVIAVAGVAGQASAAQDNWLELAKASVQTTDLTPDRTYAAAEEEGYSKPKWIAWLTVGTEFTVVSDYVWRGIVFSDTNSPDEGSEKLNYQLEVWATIDLATLFGTEVNVGSLTFDVWWEWWGWEDEASGRGNHNQEVDYTISWDYEFDADSQIATVISGVGVGYIWYRFPNLNNDAETTQEIYGYIAFNDTALWKLLGLEDFSLSPTVQYNHDLDDVQGAWLALDFSHEIALSTWCADVPVIKDMTLTPSLSLGFDHRYMDKLYGNANIDEFRLSNITWGLALGFDLGAALEMPEQYGSLSLGGFLNFSHNCKELGGYTDKDLFYGGMTVGWEW